MPRLSTINTPALRALLEQLRFGGRGALLRQIERTEALAGELDPAFAYPLHFIMQRITGYRAASGAASGGEAMGEVVRGADLFADLSSLVEHLCAMAEVSADDLPMGWLSLEALGERWGVTRRTIERYRRRGLVARRVHHSGGMVRVVFTDAAVRAFEANHAGLLRSAREFSRIDAGDAARMVGLAERYQRRLGWSATMVAGRLAARFGRSRESVRQVLRRGDGERGAALVVRGRLDEAQRTALLDAWDVGERTSAIAARFGITATGVARIVAERNTRAMLVALRAWAAGLDDGLAGDGEDAVSVERLRREPRHAEGLGWAWPTDTAALGEVGAVARPMPAELERERCVLALRVPRLVLMEIEALRGRSPSWSRADAWAARLRHAAMLKRSVACSLMGVALRAINERLGRGLEGLAPAESGEVYRSAIEAMGQALDRFALGHGQRAAGQVSQGIARRVAVPMGGPGGGVAVARARPMTRLPDGEVLLTPWSAGVALPGGVRGVLGEVLGEVLAGVWDRAEPPGGVAVELARAIAARHGVGGGMPMTVAEVAERLGVTRRAVLEGERRLRAMAAGRDAGAGPAQSANRADVAN